MHASGAAYPKQSETFLDKVFHAIELMIVETASFLKITLGRTRQ